MMYLFPHFNQKSKPFICLICFVWCAFTTCTSQAIQQEPPKVQIYQNDSIGIKFTYTDDWMVMPIQQVKASTADGNKSAQAQYGKKATDTWATIFALKNKSGNNTISFSISKFNPALHGNDYSKSRQMRFEGQGKLLEQNPGVKVDYQQSTIQIDSTTFENAQLTVYQFGTKKLFIWMYETKFNDDTLWMLNVISDSESALKNALNVIESSRISRNK